MNGMLDGIPPGKYPVPEKLVRRSMPTVVFDKETGPFIGNVVEPMYAPLSGKALAVSPLDSLEAVQVALAEAAESRQQRELAGRPYEAVYLPSRHGLVPVMSPATAASRQQAGGNGRPSPLHRLQPLYPSTRPSAGTAQPIPVAPPIGNR